MFRFAFLLLCDMVRIKEQPTKDDSCNRDGVLLCTSRHMGTHIGLPLHLLFCSFRSAPNIYFQVRTLLSSAHIFSQVA